MSDINPHAEQHSALRRPVRELCRKGLDCFSHVHRTSFYTIIKKYDTLLKN